MNCRSITLIIALFTSISTSVYAQGNIVFGKAGIQIVDQNFVALMQSMNPEFGFNPSKSVFTNRLLKDYIITKHKADIAKTFPIYKSAEVQKQIALIKQLAEEKYLATLYNRVQKDSVIPVTDAEARTYYDTHRVEFTQPGRYSYFTATVRDTTKNTVKEVVDQLKAYATIIKDEFKSGDNSTYSVTYIKDGIVSSGDIIYSLISTLNKGEYATSTNGITGSGIQIYMLMSKKPEEAIPFDQVKEQCRGNVLNAKRQQSEQQFIEEAKNKYPIVLDNPIFK